MKTETGNPNITADNIAKIQRGKTTQAEILLTFGEPIAKAQTAIGTYWTYSHSINTMTDSGFFSTGIKQDIKAIGLTVIFNDKGIVTDYSSSEVNPMQNVKISTF